MRALAPLVVAALLAGCVAETVERVKPRKGPLEAVGYIEHGKGRVRYSLEGWGWFVKGRRRSALKLMDLNCGKDHVPAIVDEYERQDADASFSGEDVSANLKHGMDHYKIEKYQHIAYECRSKAPAPDLPQEPKP